MNIIKNPRSEPAMTVEALGNKRGEDINFVRFGEYLLKYGDLQVANILSLMASQFL